MLLWVSLKGSPWREEEWQVGYTGDGSREQACMEVLNYYSVPVKLIEHCMLTRIEIKTLKKRKKGSLQSERHCLQTKDKQTPAGMLGEGRMDAEGGK